MSRPISSESDILCIDLGTTNTRLWRVAAGGNVVHRSHAPLGVRDTARDGSNARLKQTLKSLIDEASSGSPPACVVASGMITSSLGLMEIPHIPAPAGLVEIADAAKVHRFPDVTALPVILIPGIRSGPLLVEADAVSESDLMRGEETLCIGLHQLRRLDGTATVLNLGSHWKSISIDDGRIIRSTTSLAGEMIHSIQSSTILAAALPAERPDTLDPTWTRRGMEECRRNSLGRTLFTTRLLQLQDRTTPQQRYAYILGAFIESEMRSLIAPDRSGRVVIAGSPAIASAWQAALDGIGQVSEVLTADQLEQATITGMIQVAGRVL